MVKFLQRCAADRGAAESRQYSGLIKGPWNPSYTKVSMGGLYRVSHYAEKNGDTQIIDKQKDVMKSG